MQLRLVFSAVKDLKLENLFEEAEKKDAQPTFDLEVETNFTNASKREFVVGFLVRLSYPKQFNLEISHYSIFSTDDDIDEEFQKSTFASVNAPAIAFPYLRSLITTITVNSGFTPAILPSINFVKFRKKVTFIDGVKLTLPEEGTSQSQASTLPPQ